MKFDYAANNGRPTTVLGAKSFTRGKRLDKTGGSAHADRARHASRYTHAADVQRKTSHFPYPTGLFQ